MLPPPAPITWMSIPHRALQWIIPANRAVGEVTSGPAILIRHGQSGVPPTSNVTNFALRRPRLTTTFLSLPTYPSSFPTFPFLLPLNSSTFLLYLAPCLSSSFCPFAFV